MAQWYRVQVIIPHDNGLPEDAVINTWHYSIAGSGDRAVLASDFEAQLDAFYTGWVTTMASSAMDWTQIVTKHYDFLEDQPRLPFYEGTITPGAPTASLGDWPAEVSVCLSMQGLSESGVNMRRRRGRVYLGPFAGGASDWPLFPNAYADQIATAADSAFFGTGVAQLSIYSPYTHHGVAVGDKLTKEMPEIPDFLPASFNEAERVWCDNAWDTQRRRGLKATYRKTFNK